jgi:hypothetical protein
MCVLVFDMIFLGVCETKRQKLNNWCFFGCLLDCFSLYNTWCATVLRYYGSSATVPCHSNHNIVHRKVHNDACNPVPYFSKLLLFLFAAAAAAWYSSSSTCYTILHYVLTRLPTNYYSNFRFSLELVLERNHHP